MKANNSHVGCSSYKSKKLDEITCCLRVFFCVCLLNIIIRNCPNQSVPRQLFSLFRMIHWTFGSFFFSKCSISMKCRQFSKRFLSIFDIIWLIASTTTCYVNQYRRNWFFFYKFERKHSTCSSVHLPWVIAQPKLPGSSSLNQVWKPRI